MIHVGRQMFLAVGIAESAQVIFGQFLRCTALCLEMGNERFHFFQTCAAHRTGSCGFLDLFQCRSSGIYGLFDPFAGNAHAIAYYFFHIHKYTILSWIGYADKRILYETVSENGLGSGTGRQDRKAAPLPQCPEENDSRELYG